MKENILVGVPGGRNGHKSLITKQIYKNYINTGSYLINVTKYKSEKIYTYLVK